MPSRARRIRRLSDDLGIYGLPGDVSPWDLRFDPTKPADLEPLGGGRLRLRLHAEPGLGDGCAVVRTSEGVLAIPMVAMEAGRFVLWSAEVGPFEEAVGLSFAFVVEESGRPVYLVPSGTSSSVERLDRWTIEPGLEPIDTPQWAKGAVIYQIFPERFANGDPSNDPEDALPWNAAPASRRFQGGDLDGVVQRLDHLQRIGVDALYLNPVFLSPSNHKYDTIDYMRVDPAFGGDDALRRLVQACHGRGIRVILDASFNHAHPRFFAFADLLERGKRSQYRGWFAVHDWPPRVKVRRGRLPRWMAEWLPSWEAETGIALEDAGDDGPPLEPTYEAWYGVPTMPRVDLSHPAARAYMLDVARYWLEVFDIDGWRMDVARYVDRDFWPDFRAACRSVKPDAYLLAEIMGDPSAWLAGGGFDATMNYPVRFMALGFFARGDMDGAEFLDHCARLYGRHALATTLVNHNLVGSHDTPRFLTEAGGELWRSELAAVFQLTFPGAPGLYYGDELGMEGGGDPGCRGTMPWDRLGRHGYVDTIAELTALRRRIPTFRTGAWRPLASQRDAVAFERSSVGARYAVGLNRAARTAELPVAGKGAVVWGDGHHDAGVLRIGPRSGVIVRR